MRVSKNKLRKYLLGNFIGIFAVSQNPVDHTKYPGFVALDKLSKRGLTSVLTRSTKVASSALLRFAGASHVATRKTTEFKASIVILAMAVPPPHWVSRTSRAETL
jgi:hypothetical protein